MRIVSYHGWGREIRDLYVGMSCRQMMQSTRKKGKRELLLPLPRVLLLVALAVLVVITRFSSSNHSGGVYVYFLQLFFDFLFQELAYGFRYFDSWNFICGLA